MRRNVLALHGSKTPGELALVLEDTILVTGDLVRGHVFPGYVPRRRQEPWTDPFDSC